MEYRFVVFWFHFWILVAPARSSSSSYQCWDNEKCAFKLKVTRRRTMTYTEPVKNYTFPVGLNDTKLIAEESLFRRAGPDYPYSIIGQEVSPADVITADGYPRSLMVINGQFPGPTLEVLHGVMVEVEVENGLLTEGFTLHWHGQHQGGTPFMDGTPGVNQCPIHPHQRFTYRFKADPSGTHWYHGHHGFQRIEGLIGMFIVHSKQPVIPEISLIVTDWFHADGHEIETAHPCGINIKGHGDYVQIDTERDRSVDGIELSATKYLSTLLGGRGRWENKPFPLEVFKIETGKEYRFRLVNAAGEFSYEISIDDHQLTIDSSDGHDLEPFVVDVLMIHPGERMDFTITVNATSDTYWMRAETINADKSVFQGAYAILATTNTTEDPTTQPRNCTEDWPCIVFNCPFPVYPTEHNKTCVSLHEAKASPDTLPEEKIAEEFGTKDDNPFEIFINMASTSAAAVNARRFKLPRAPVHQLNDSNIMDYIFPCDEEQCKEECTCTNVMALPGNTTIQMVLLSYDFQDFHHHVAHLHGNAFAVMKTGFFTVDNDTGTFIARNQDIQCDGTFCYSASWNGSAPTDLNHINPPIKDSIIIPTNGYVVTRFRTTNPGYWILHCHQETHVLEGMAIVFNIAPGEHFPLPKNFPTCWDFEPEKEDEKDDDKEEDDDKEKEDENKNEGGKSKVNLSVGQLVGTAIGFTILGSFVTALILILYKWFGK